MTAPNPWAPAASTGLVASYSGRTYEELTDDEIFLRQVLALRIDGKTYGEIGEHFKVAPHVMKRIAARMPRYAHEETKQMAREWFVKQFVVFESMNVRMARYLMDDPTVADPKPPNPKDITAYVQLVRAQAQLAVLGSGGNADAEEVEELAAGTGKAHDVLRYRELTLKMYAGVLKSGVIDADYADEDDELATADVRADNSGTISEATVLDPTQFVDEDLDSQPGQWVDGKFVREETT